MEKKNVHDNMIDLSTTTLSSFVQLLIFKKLIHHSAIYHRSNKMIDQSILHFENCKVKNQIQTRNLISENTDWKQLISH